MHPIVTHDAPERGHPAPHSSSRCAFSLRFLEHQAHQPRRHRPNMTIQIALDHHPGGIVQAGFNHRDRCVTIFIRSADQIRVSVALRLNALWSKGQCKLSRVHVNLSGRWQRRYYLDYAAAKEVVRTLSGSVVSDVNSCALRTSE